MWLGKRTTLASICLLMTAGTCFAQETGTAARLGMGARPLALGGAFVSIPDDATSVFWNPAALATVHSTRVQLHYRRLTASHALDSGTVVFGPPRHGIVWGASLNVMHRAGIAAEDALGSFSGEPGASEFSGQATMAVLVHPTLSLGFSAGPIISTLQSQTERHMGWGGNAGLLWRQAGTSVGFGVLGITAGLASDEAPQPYRYRLSTGVSQRVGDPLLLSMQLDRDRGADPRLSSGLEWAVGSMVRLRAGVQHPFSDIDAVDVFSNGLGVQGGRFRMDYAVRYAKEFSPEHLLTLRFQLGDEVELQQQQGEDAVTQVESPRPPESVPTVLPHANTAAPSVEAVAPATRVPSHSTPEEVARPARRTLPVVARDGLPSPPRPDGTTSLTIPAPGRVHYVVRAGVHADLDEAALEIARFYRAEIRPRVEKRGELFIVVVQRCDTLEEAQAWQARVGNAGLRCTIDEE